MSLFFRPLLWLITFLSVGSVSYADLISFPPLESKENRGILKLELSPKDEFLIALLSDHSLRLFDIREAKPIQLQEFPGNSFYMQEDERFEYAFSRDGDKLALSYKENIHICTLKPAYHCERITTSWKDKVTAISFTHDGKSIIFATSFRNIYVLDLSSKEYLFSRRISSKIHGIASLNNNSIVTISEETPMIWRFDDGYRTLLSNLLLRFYKLPSKKVRTRADGETIYIEDQATGFLTYNAANGELIGKGISAEVQDSGMTVSGDGTRIALSKFNEINIYSALGDSARLQRINCEDFSSHASVVAFSQENENLLYLGNGDGKIFTIDLKQYGSPPNRSRL